jgi:hypothetical protein
VDDVEYKEWYNKNAKGAKQKREANSNRAVLEYDAKTKTLIHTWKNRQELISHYKITLNYFNKLIALPMKRWLKGKTYLVYGENNI